MLANIFEFIKDINNGVKYFTIPVVKDDTVRRLHLRPVTRNLKNYEVELMAKWRAKNQHIFKDPNPITIEGTKKWFLDTHKENRLLFFIESADPVGHMGIYRIDLKDDSLEIDNVIRGTSQHKGIMHLSLSALIKWATRILKPKKIYLAVLKKNINAIEFYKKNRFKVFKDIERNGEPHYKMIYEAESRVL